MQHQKYFVVSIYLLGLLGFVSSQKCRETCQPPDCSCPRFSYPMDRHEIPQMVYFGFDDAVNPVMSSLYDKIFIDERTNPNGCPIKMTLFISHQYTDYNRVKRFYENGHEIAVHSVTHSAIDNEIILRKEAKEQKDNLVKLAGVSPEDIVGWRSPFLKPAGNSQPKVLKELGYEYDISLTYSRPHLDVPKPWPFTMDNGWPYKCGVPPCPTGARVKNFWAVPVVSLMDHKDQYPCSFVDGCVVRASSENNAYKYLMDNFMSYYNTTRTPFGLNMHAAWFYTRYNLKAMIRFVEDIGKLDDVYVVTVKQMLDWMKNPTPVSNIKNLKSWQCSDKPAASDGLAVSSPLPATTRRPFTRRPLNQIPTNNQWPIPMEWRNQISRNRPFVQVRTAPRSTPTTKITPKPTTTTTTTPTPKPTTTSTTTTTTTPKPTTTTTTTPKPTTTTTTTTKPTTTTTTPQTTTTIRTTRTPKPTTSTSEATELIENGPIEDLFGHISDFEIPNNPPRPAAPALPWWKSVVDTSAIDNEGTLCIQGLNCHLPNCFCQGTIVPNNMKLSDIPQLVYLTIDGSVNAPLYRRYRQFVIGKRNPNGCPVRGTVFVTGMGSRPRLIKALKNIGAEIALRGLHQHHYDTAKHLEVELKAQIRAMKTLNITAEGWKTPELKALGNDQFSLLQDNGMKYDTTILESVPKAGEFKHWPYTLDYSYNGDCTVPICPTKKFPGIWELPSNSLHDYRKMFECAYIDGCMFNPPTMLHTENFLWDNFMEGYETNKAPFGIHLRQVWFSHPAYRDNLQGLMNFIDKLLTLKDVYLVSAGDVITWMKNPVAVKDMTNTTPWNCV